MAHNESPLEFVLEHTTVINFRQLGDPSFFFTLKLLYTFLYAGGSFHAGTCIAAAVRRPAFHSEESTCAGSLATKS